MRRLLCGWWISEKTSLRGSVREWKMF